MASLSMAVSVVSMTAFAGAPSSGLQSITEREIQRRQQLVSDAQTQLDEAILIDSKGEHAKAAEQLMTIYKSLPDAPSAVVLKNSVRAAYANAACAEASDLLAKAEYARAQEMIGSVLDPQVDPKNEMALRLKKRSADPDRYPPALSPQHLANADKVNRLLVSAGSYTDLGDYNKAIAAYQEALHLDPYNVAARRGLDAVEGRKGEYFDTARDQKRASALNEVSKGWEHAVPPSTDLSNLFNSSAGGGSVTKGGREKLETKLRTTIIPKAEFNGATLEEVIEYLRVTSRSNDPQGTGIGFVLNVEAETKARAITLTLKDVPLEEVLRYICEMSGTAYRVEENAVSIFSLSQKAMTLIQKTYKVPPDFIQKSEVAPAAAADPFAANPGGAPATSGLTRMGAKEFLESRGVVFPDGGGASFSSANSTLTVRATADNLNLIDVLVGSAMEATPKQAKITVRVVEIAQTNLNELGFDSTLGQFNIPGSDRSFGTGGTVGNQGAPALFPGGNGNIVSAGLRSVGALASINGIDAQIAQSKGSGDPAGTDARSPTQFSLAGVFTDPQFQFAIRSIEQKKGTDILNLPSVVTKSGQKASIRSVREFPYPTEFDPPQIPQQVGNTNQNGGGTSSLALLFNGVLQFGQTSTSNNGAPVIPATPTAFEVKELGMVLDVEPNISADGRTVEVSIAPSFTEFEGFINYGSDIKATASGNIVTTYNQGITSVTQPPSYTQPNKILQPVFRKSALGSPVVVNVYDGSTITLGGLVTERNGDVSDKVPFIGDLPLVGRLWQSKVRQTEKKALMFFVTVEVLDPAGQRVNQPQATASAP